MGEGPLILRSRREIRLMRQAGLVVWKAHQAAAKVVRPGAATQEIENAVAEVFREHNAEPLFQGQPGPYPFPAVTCVSVNDQIVHGIPGDRELKEGDIVSIDTGCKVKGWCGDAAVTHPVGVVSSRAAKLLEVTAGTLDLAIELLATQEYWSQVASRMERFVQDQGFSVVRSFVGHGIGRNLHEDPQVPNFFSEQLRKNDIPLRPGLVIAVEPMVNGGSAGVRGSADGWTQRTEDGQWSAHFEHTIALTKDGPQLLTGPPAEGEEIE